MSYQQCTRFRTTVDSDRKYLWNGSSNRQSVNGITIYDFSTFGKKIGELWFTNKKNDLDLWPMTLKFNMVHVVIIVHVRAKFHQAEFSGSWVIMNTNLKNLKIQSRDHDLWPWNSLGFEQMSRYVFVWNLIKLSVPVHELSCWQRKPPTKTIQSVATTRTVKKINKTEHLF